MIGKAAGETDRDPGAVAIVGMACLFPGADGPARFWRNIVDRVDAVGEPPPGWRADRYCEDARASVPVYAGRGGYLGDLCRFDPARFGVMPSAVEGAEPDQFLALRCAVEALADAGVPGLPLNRESTGVFLGRGLFFNRGSLTWTMQGMMVDEVVDLLRRIEPGRPESDLETIRAELKRNLPPFNSETVAGVAHCDLTGRIMNRLDLKGPAYTLDAACSSALVAVDHGVRELAAGRCDAVLAGGVQVSTPALVHQAFCQIEALSRSGRVAPFAADADGTLLGEGCGIVVLKRLADAERDGNRIYALIRGCSVSSDGKGAGLLAPRADGQELAIRRAYEWTGLDPRSVGLIEAHGTGIPLGDRTELASLTACFGTAGEDGPSIALGSVKSMIGHLLPASGAASLIKVALALHHRTYPPTLHAESAAAGLSAAGATFYPSTRARPWVHGDPDSPRRAGINAFGFGGINAHAILEEYRSADEPESESLETDWPVELVVVSAGTEAELAGKAEALAGWAGRAEGVRLLDVASACAEEPGACRLAIVARDLPDLARKLAHASGLLAKGDRARIQDRGGVYWYREPLARSGRVAFVFPGEGAQYPEMLADLCRHFPEARREFDLTDRALRRLGPGRSLSRVVYPPAADPDAAAAMLGLEEAVVAVTAAGRALLAVLGRLGIRPDAVVGHSSGEFAALIAAGAIDLADEEDQVRSIAEGAEAARRLAASGVVPPAVLTAVGGVDRAAVDEALAAAGPGIVVAMDNCPNQLVLVGDEASTAALREALQGRGGLCERLPWGRAYHTEAASPACPIVEGYLRSVGLKAPRVELWSCVTTERYAADPASTLGLAVRQWRSPVYFRETVRAMHAAGVRVFVEVGPRGGLTAFVADSLADEPFAAIPLDLPRRDGRETLCRALGMLAAHGVPFDLPALYRRRRPRPLDLLDGPPVPAPPQPILEQSLPALTLSEAVAARLRAPARAPEPPAPATNGQATNGTVRHAPLPIPPPIAARLAPPEPVPAPALIPAPAGGPSLARDLAEYQQTMRVFLEIQERVTLARFAAQSAPGAAPAMPAPAPSPAPASSNGAVALAPMPAAMPDLGAPVVPARNGAPSTEIDPPPGGTGSPLPVLDGHRPTALVEDYQCHPASSAATDPASIERALTAIVADRTGYPAEMLDPEADLEADLGIDSIKRVEVIAALRRSLGDPRGGPMEGLAAARSLRAIARVLAGASASATAPNPAPTAPSPPFLTRIVSTEPGVRLVAEAELDAARHRFLVDHTFFGRGLSVSDPARAGLPIMPLAGTLELMAEAAVALRPGRSVRAIRDVRTQRWLAFETPTRVVRLEATAEGDDVRLVALEADVDGAPIAEATFELADPVELGPAVVPDPGSPPFPWPAEDIYGRILYHGPAFRGVAAMEASGPSGVRASVVQPDPALIAPGGLVLPVALIDILGQVAGIVVRHSWTETEAHLTFPNRMGRLELAPGPIGPAPLRATTRIERRESQVISDIEMVEPSGRVAIRALGRSEEFARFPRDLYDYWSSPRRTALGRDVGDLFPTAPRSGGWGASVPGQITGPFLVGRLWSRVVARMILSAAEEAAFDALKLAPVPAAAWLLGRIAAKDALRRLGGLDVGLADLAIEDGPSPRLDLAVDGFSAIAATIDPGSFVGVGVAIDAAGAPAEGPATRAARRALPGSAGPFEVVGIGPASGLVTLTTPGAPGGRVDVHRAEIGAASAFLCLVPAHDDGGEPPAMKTVLFGLDGATFTVLDPLAASGVMPRLARLYREGSRAILGSTPMPITPQAWTSLSTGRGAGHHGVHDFIRPEPAPGGGVFWRVNDSRDVACRTIWEYASEQGRRVTVLNYINLAPPRPIAGHSMPGFVSGRHLRRSSHPPDLFDRLAGVEGLDVAVLGLDQDIERLALQDMEPDRWVPWIRHHIDRERAWFAVLEHLMDREPSDLTAIVLDGVDKIQHLAYRFLDPSYAPADPSPWERGVIAACLDYFGQVDDFLGRTIDRVGDDGRVFVASDHGFTATTEVFYVNKWLHDQGWLAWREGLEEDRSNAILGERMIDLANAIDFDRTRAYALTPTSNGVRIGVPPGQYHAFRDEVARRLLDLRGPDGGRVVTEIKRREDWFPGPFLERAPDLTLTLRDFGLISVLNARAAVVPRPEPSGTHHPDGILIARGPGIRAGAVAEPANILDVAPTLAHSLGLEIPADYEGTFVASFYEPSYLAADPPRVGEGGGAGAPIPGFDADGVMDSEDEAIVLERLKNLGYLE